MEGNVLVIGQGEIGAPLADVLERRYRVVRRDIEPLDVVDVDVLHVCYPFEIDDFVGVTAAYVEQYRPRLVIVNSTVVPGTTRAIQEHVQQPVVYSPVRGKHVRMREDLLKYAKFVAGPTQADADAAAEHFGSAGLKAAIMSSPEVLELAKLFETSYFGVLIAWAQEMDRFCRAMEVDYEEAMRFVEEIDFLPRVVYTPGFIGGHCVIPNSYLLEQVGPSLLLEAMRASNELKMREWSQAGRSLERSQDPVSFDEAAAISEA